MWGLEEDPKGEVWNGDMGDHAPEQKALIPSMPVKVVDGEDKKEDQNFLEILLLAHFLLGVGVPIKEVIKVPSSWPWQECPERVTDQCGQEGVLGWRSTC